MSKWKRFLNKKYEFSFNGKIIGSVFETDKGWTYEDKSSRDDLHYLLCDDYHDEFYNDKEFPVISLLNSIANNSVDKDERSAATKEMVQFLDFRSTHKKESNENDVQCES